MDTTDRARGRPHNGRRVGVLDRGSRRDKHSERDRERADVRSQAETMYHPDTCHLIFHGVLELLSVMHERYTALKKQRPDGERIVQELKNLRRLFTQGCETTSRNRIAGRRNRHITRVNSIRSTWIRRINEFTCEDVRGEYTDMRSVRNIPHDREGNWTSAGNWAQHAQCELTDTECRGCYACNATEHHNHTSECNRTGEYDRSSHRICYKCNQQVTIASGHDARNCDNQPVCVDWAILGNEGGCDGKHASFDCPLRAKRTAERRAKRESRRPTDDNSRPRRRDDRDDTDQGGDRGDRAGNAPNRGRGGKRGGNGSKDAKKGSSTSDTTKHDKGGGKRGGKKTAENEDAKGGGEDTDLRKVGDGESKEGGEGDTGDREQKEERPDGSDLIQVSGTGVANDPRAPGGTTLAGQWDTNLSDLSKANAQKAKEETEKAGRLHAKAQARRRGVDEEGKREAVVRVQSIQNVADSESDSESDMDDSEMEEGASYLQEHVPVPPHRADGNREEDDAGLRSGDATALAEAYMAKRAGERVGTVQSYFGHSHFSGHDPRDPVRPIKKHLSEDRGMVKLIQRDFHGHTGHYHVEETEEKDVGNDRASKRHSDRMVETIKETRALPKEEMSALRQIEELTEGMTGCTSVDLESGETFVAMKDALEGHVARKSGRGSDRESKNSYEYGGDHSQGNTPTAMTLVQYVKTTLGANSPMREHEEGWGELKVTRMDKYDMDDRGKYSYKGLIGLEELILEGNMVGLTIDSGAERNHMSKDHPGITRRRRMRKAMVAITANGGRTLINEYGYLEGYIYDVDGKRTWVVFKCLITEGMGKYDVLISASSLSKEVGQYRAGSDLKHLPSVCKILQEEGTGGGAADAVVDRRFAVFRVHKAGPANDGEREGGSYILPLAPNVGKGSHTQLDTNMTLLSQAQVETLVKGCFMPYQCQQDKVLRQWRRSLGAGWLKVANEVIEGRKFDEQGEGKDAAQRDEDDRVEQLELRAITGQSTGAEDQDMDHGKTEKAIQRLQIVKGLLQPSRGDLMMAGNPVKIKSVPGVPVDKQGRVGMALGKIGSESVYRGGRVRNTWRVMLGSTKEGGHDCVDVAEQFLIPMTSAIGEEHLIDAIEGANEEERTEPRKGTRVRHNGKNGTVTKTKRGGDGEKDETTVALDAGGTVTVESVEMRSWSHVRTIGVEAGTRHVVWPPSCGQTAILRDQSQSKGTNPDKIACVVIDVTYGDGDEAPNQLPNEIILIDVGGKIHRNIPLEHLVPCLDGELTKKTANTLHRKFSKMMKKEGFGHLAGVSVTTGERASSEGIGVRWPPTVGDRVLHNGGECTVTGKTDNGVDGRMTTQVARENDGLQTLDVQTHDMSPVVQKEEEQGPYRKSTAAGMRSGGKGRHYKHMGAARWVGYVLHVAMIWHIIFGHAGMGRIKKTLAATLGGGLKGEWPRGDEIGPCQGCDASKPRNRFLSRKVTVRPREPWELVALDHPGVNKGQGRGLPTTPEGGTTPHLSIECFSGFVFFHELKDHSGAEVARVIGDLADTAYSTSRKSIATFNADGAKCYTQGVVPRLVAHLGGNMTYSHAYSSNGNGRVERCISSVYKIARKLLAWSKMPMAMWGYACRWAAHLNNILVGTEGNVTPHELLFGSPPILTELRVWGSLGCFTNVSKSLRAGCKLQPTSRYGYFVGNAPQRRGVTMLHTRINARKRGKVSGVMTQTRDAIIWNLLKARDECPADLRHLLGPAEDEARALDALKANPRKPDLRGEQEEYSATSPNLPTRFSGEPDLCDAKHFEGDPVCRMSPTGGVPICGNVLCVRRNHQERGEPLVIDDSQPPGRVMYGVEWKQGEGVEQPREWLEWPEMSPILTHGHLTPNEPGVEHKGGEDDGDNEGQLPCYMTCREGHALGVSSAGEELQCDECPGIKGGGTLIRKGDMHMRCTRRCDYDVCMGCADAITRGEQSLRDLEDADIGDEGSGDIQFEPGDRVLILGEHEGKEQQLSGEVVELVPAGIKVMYDIDGGTTVIKYEEAPMYLTPASEPRASEEAGSSFRQIGGGDESRGSRIGRLQGRADSGASLGIKRTTRSSCSIQSVDVEQTSTPWDVNREGERDAEGKVEEETLEKRVQDLTEPYLHLDSGNATEMACLQQAKEGMRGVLLLHQFTSKKRSKVGGRMETKATWCNWLPWVEEQSVGNKMAGKCRRLDGIPGADDEPAVVRIMTDEGRKTSLVERGKQWGKGLEDLLCRRESDREHHILAGADVYIGVGEGCSSAAGRWYEHYMPWIAVFARQAHEKHGARTHIVRDNSTPDAWYREGRYAPRDELWTATLLALGEDAGGKAGTGGSHYQSNRKGLPSVNRILCGVCDDGQDVFAVTSGVADPSDYDGMYPATTDSCDLRSMGVEDDGPIGNDENHVGAPVRFATSDTEHQAMKDEHGGIIEAPMACYDPLELQTMAGEDAVREVGLAEDLDDIHVRQQQIARDLEAALDGDPDEAAMQEEGDEDPYTPTEGVGMGYKINSTLETIQAWNMCQGEKAAIDVLLKAEESEPSIRDALRGPVKYAWLQSYIAEIRTQLSQGVFVLIRREDAPVGGNIMRSGIRCLVKWQHHATHGHSPYRLKTRFVAGGDSQVHGVDFTMTSSPTPRPASIRTIFSRATEEGFVLRTCDISGAFCNSPVEYEGMCMEMPLYLAPDDSVAHPGGLPTGHGKDHYRRRHNESGRPGKPPRHRPSVSASKLPKPQWDPIGEAAACKSNAGRRRAGASAYCLRLEKMIYGTRQASRCWFAMWVNHMIAEGFTISSGDECVFYKFDPDTGEGLVVATHVDDSLVLATSEEVYQEFYRRIRLKFEATDEGAVKWFLGIKVDWDSEQRQVTLSQEALCEAMHTELGEHRSKMASTPMIENSHLVAGGAGFQLDPHDTPAAGDGLSENRELWNELTRALAHGGMMEGYKNDPLPQMTRMERAAVAQYPYRRVLGMALHLVSWTRPDIAFVVCGLARFGDPTKCTWRHCQALSRLVMYLYGTRKMGITYTGGLGVRGDPQVRGYVDADHAGNPETRKSMTGFVIMARGAAISWTSSRQRIVAQSSYESELIATRHVTAEFMAIEKDYFAIEQQPAPTPFKLGCDNQSVVHVANGGGSVSKRKHVATRYFLVLEAVKERRVELVKVDTDDNPSDIMTKSLGIDKFHKFRDIIMGRKGNCGDAKEMGIRM